MNNINKKIRLFIGMLLSVFFYANKAKAQSAIDVYGIDQYMPPANIENKNELITALDKIGTATITIIVLGVVALIIGTVYLIKRKRTKNV